MLHFTDAVVLDSPRKTRDGYLAGAAKIARTGIQLYAGREIDPKNELGLRDKAEVRVYRPPEAVFDDAAMAGLAFKPVTNDHPAGAVDATNWKKLSVGVIGGDIAQEGKFIRVPLALMDATAIADFEAGKKEFSVGYTCELTVQDGVTPEGERYDAVQSDIKPNHLALCWKARGGPELRLGDGDHPAKGGHLMATKTILVDGLQVEVTDAAEAAINKLQGTIKALQDQAAKDQAKIGELTAAVATKDGEIAGLNQKVKDAEVTPAKLQALADARATVIADAKKILGDSFDAAGKTEGEIKRAAVSHRLGDAAKEMSDDAVSGAFRALVPTGDAGQDGMREAIRDGAGQAAGGADKAYTDYKKELSDAWRTKDGASAA